MRTPLYYHAMSKIVSVRLGTAKGREVGTLRYVTWQRTPQHGATNGWYHFIDGMPSGGPYLTWRDAANAADAAWQERGRASP